MEDLIKKFKFRGSGLIINAPKEFETEFTKTGFTSAFEKNVKSTNTLVFISNNKEYRDFLENHLESVQPDSVLWFAYPKGSSKIKTDINRDSIRETGEEHGITTVTAISINDTWSALRFRPIEKVGK